MPRRERVITVRVDEDLMKGLEHVAERDGILQSEQVRRAIRAWLETKGVIKKTERRRANTRKRS